MNRLGAIGLTLGLLLTGAWNLSAQDQPASPAATTDEGDSKLTAWQWMQEVRLPAATATYYAIALPPDVIGKSRPDMPDLRLADSDGKRVPFALRVLRTTSIQQIVHVVRQYDAGPVPGKNYYEVSLELADTGPYGHNEIEIATRGKDFRRKVQVLGDNKADFAEARQLLDKDKYIAHYVVDGTIIDVRRVRYTPNKVRFLKVRVFSDASVDEEIPKIDTITVRFAEAIVGEEMTLPARLEPRLPVKVDFNPGSAWFIDLGPEPLPCERLIFTVDGPPAERQFRLEVVDQENRQQYVPTHPWTWRKINERNVLEIELMQELGAKRLRLKVTDFANAPMNLTGVQYAFAVRQVVFSLPDPTKYKLPLRLFFGNPTAGPSNYDFARRLPPNLTPTPEKAELGSIESNPFFVPSIATLEEQMPWLIYVILGLTSAVLLVILLMLARTAIRRHDVAERPA